MNYFASLSARIARPALLTSALACAIAFAVPAIAQDTKPADTQSYTLVKRKFKSGDVNRYKMAMKIHGTGIDTSVNMLFKETIKDAKPTGEFTISEQFETAMTTFMGTEQDISALLPVVTVTRDKAGKLSVKSEGGNEQIGGQISQMMQALPTMQDAFVPKMTVKIGDKWKVGSPPGSASTSEGEATLVATEIVGGVKTLKLKVVGTTDDKQGNKGKSDSIVNLDADTGRLIKVVSKIEGSANGIEVTQEMELSLVKDEKAAAAAKS